MQSLSHKVLDEFSGLIFEIQAVSGLNFKDETKEFIQNLVKKVIAFISRIYCAATNEIIKSFPTISTDLSRSKQMVIIINGLSNTIRI